MSDPFALSLVITHADGSETRWGPDEVDARDQPAGLSFSTVNPGGFEALSCDLLRRIDQDSADLSRYDTVTVYDPAGDIVWQGRFTQFPRQTADGYTISPGAEGWSAHLRDNQGFREIYVDRDLSRWGEQSLQRQLDLGTGNPVYPNAGDASIATDPTTPALRQSMQQIDASTSSSPQRRPIVESWYDAANVAVGALYYSQSSGNRATNVLPLGAGWNVVAYLGDSLTSGTENTGNMSGGASSGYLTTTAATRVAAMIQFYFSGTFSGSGDWYVDWKNLAVYGTHGLTRRGSDPGGFYASDILPHALTAGAPLITYDADSIQDTSIVLSQLAFVDPGPVEEVVKRCNAVHIWDWFVWEGRKFWFHEPGAGRSVTWTVRLDDGAHLADDGPAAQDIINGVIVAYNNPGGDRRFAGPVGSTCQVTDASLSSADADNEATLHGITRWDVLELSQPAIDDFAVDVGAAYLAERSTPQHRGQAVITGMARHPTRGLRPAFWIRAGDYVQFTDVNDDSIGQPRRVIHTGYDHENRACTLDLDSTPYTLDALLSLLDASLLNI